MAEAPMNTPGAEVLAIAVNFVHTIADGQQLSFGTAFAIDMPRAEKNRVLDMLADLSRRQAAIARKPIVLEELRKHRETLAQFVEDAGRAEAAWPEEEAKLQAAIAELEDDARHEAKLDELKGQIAADLTALRTRRQDEYNAGLEEWKRLGRVADYKPRGSRETNLSRMDAQIKQAEEVALKMLEQAEYDRLKGLDEARERLSKACAERDVVVKNYDISVKRYEQAIQVREEELAELDKLIED